MMINAIEGCTRVLGKSQGYLGLPVCDCKVDGADVMLSSWQPTPAEQAALASGAPIYVWVYGTQHPPIALSVGEVPKL